MKKTDSWYGMVLLLLILPFYTPHTTINDDWVFKKENEGIKIYTRESADSNIKELKFTTAINATMSNAIALLIDVETYTDWVFKCSQSTTLEEISNLESYCYYRVDFPWPMSDRDMVVYSRVTQDPITKEVVSESYGQPRYLPEYRGFVRIKDHFNKWILTPVAPDRIEITYFLKSDPAGNIPAWAVNLAIDQGPVKSMKRFIKLLGEDKYQVKHVRGIEDY